jgi:1-acyl-sn-glycerol-3-phosphate acyltransferase
MAVLTRLGVPRLWHEDTDRFWPFLWRFVTPVVLWMAPSAAYGVERVPLEGGAVVAVNHFSGIDHPLIGSYSPRPVFFMAKEELLSMPLFGELITWTGAFPVRRGAVDREALRRSRELLRDGKLVGYHLEGTRQRFGHPGEIRAGGLMMAVQEGVPVVPCAVDTFRWSPWNRRQCAVVWGEPIAVDDLPRGRSGYDEAGERIWPEVIRLWRLAAEAVAAGLPEQLSDGTRRSGRIPVRGGPPPGLGSRDGSNRRARVSH